MNNENISGNHVDVNSTTTSMQLARLQLLFEEGLKDIYWAEIQLTTLIPKMIDHAKSDELIQALEDHLTETVEQINRLDQAFELLGKQAAAKKCEAIDCLIDEAEELISHSEAGVMRDAAIISAAHKFENYEIATFSTLCEFAEILGLTDAAELLEQTLEEEKVADETLTEVYVDAVNMQVFSQ